MARFIHRIIKRFGKKFGYTITIIKDDKRSNSNICLPEKNILLRNFLTILINQGYHPEVIYDIGANKGSWTMECLKYFPDATYYLFEPQKELEKDINLSLGHLANIHLFSLGVGKENEIKKFTIHSRDDSCSFSFSSAEAKRRGFEQIELNIIKLDSFVKENKLNAPSILKIDAEGLDIEVLEGACSLLQKVEVIMIEVGVMNTRIKNSALETLNYLDGKGFRLFDVTDINRPFSNEVLWLCEFAFIKKNGVLDKDYSNH